MAYITVGQENSTDINIHYEDHGQGDVLVLIHGYPFSGTAWEKEEAAFLSEGYRVITYDRRGFGLSSKTSMGYDYDTFAKDLDILMTKLDLRNVTLVGHSMGTGEIARYLGTYGEERVSRAVFVAPIPPFLLKTNDNPNGVPKEVFSGFQKAIESDRYAFISVFLSKFYNLDKPIGKSLTKEKLDADFNLASLASPIGFNKCVETWTTDFRKDLPKIKVPCLVIQGDDDQILPFELCGKLLASLLNCPLKVIAGGSHGIPWTHADFITSEILGFIGSSKGKEVPLKKGETGKSAALH